MTHKMLSLASAAGVAVDDPARRAGVSGTAPQIHMNRRRRTGGGIFRQRSQNTPLPIPFKMFEASMLRCLSIFSKVPSPASSAARGFRTLSVRCGHAENPVQACREAARKVASIGNRGSNSALPNP